MTKCHIVRGALCQYKKLDEMGLDYYKAYVSFMDMTRSWIYKDNEECVKNIINSDYWISQDKIKTSEGVTKVKYIILGSFVILVFLVSFISLSLYYNKKINEHNSSEK